ncbi:MAG TPA: recombinase zinc beta ribbon domain-containing protein [Leptolyngbyaceae cyanobacterium]
MKQFPESSAFEEPASNNQALKYLPSPHLSRAEIARDVIDLIFEKQGFNRGLKAAKAHYGLGVNHSKRNGTDGIFYFSKRGLPMWALNPVLCGHTCYERDKRVGQKRVLKPIEDWKIIRNTHPDQRLLTEEEFDELLAIRERNMRVAGGGFPLKPSEIQEGSNYKPYAYQTFVFCAECGSRCTRKTGSKGKYRYVACRHSGHGCSNRKSVRQGDIEEALINHLVERSLQLSQGTETLTTVPTPVKLQRQSELEKRLAYLETMPGGFDTDVEGLKEKLRQQIQEEINPFATDKMADKTAEELIRAGNNLGIWQSLTSDEKMKIYPRIVNKIFIRHGSVELILFKA